MPRLARRGLTTKEIGQAAIRQADPDDGFGFIAQCKREAKTAAEAQGHVLGAFVERKYTDGAFDAYCERCNRIATVNVTGRPVTTPVYGHALTQSCGKGATNG